jgi:hypothetical protein
MRSKPSPADDPGHAATWTLFEDRASTQVLGFALMFAVTMTTFALYQADVVPHQNEAIEHQHNHAMAEEMGKLRSASQRASHGVPAAATLKTGVTYPKRAIAVNPPSVPGGLRTTGTHTVELTDIEPVDGSYWSGSSPDFQTRMVTYDADYTHIEGAAYSLEHGIPVKQFENGEHRIVGSPNVIDGNRIDLMLLAGEFEQTGQSTTVEVQPVSTSMEYRTLKQQSGTITLPTHLSQSEWESLVPSHVGVSVDTAPDPNKVTLTLDPGRTYQLRITKLKLVGADGSASRAPVEMLTAETASPLPVNPDEATPLTVTARDKYGNPVLGVEIEFDPSSSTIGSTQTIRTGEDGEATYRITPADPVNGDVMASVVSGSQSVTFDLQKPTGTGAGSAWEVYTSGQMSEDVGGISGITLSNAWTVRTTDENCRLMCDTGGIVGGILGLFNSDYTIWTASGDIYLESSSPSDDDLWVEYHVVDKDNDGNVAENDDGVYVEIRSKKKLEQNNKDALLFTGELNGGAANEVVDKDDTGTDILDAGNYKETNWEDSYSCGITCTVHWGENDGFDDFDDVTDELTDVDAFVEAAAGRVTVEMTD